MSHDLWYNYWGQVTPAINPEPFHVGDITDTALLILAIVLSCIALSVAIYVWLTKHSPSPRRVVTKEIPEDMVVTVGPETRESLVINGVVTYRKVEGFEYEEGYVCRLRVIMKKGQYRLVEVVSKEPMVE